MAKEKNYNNYVEIVGNVSTIYQEPANNAKGEMRFKIANHRTYTKKDGTKDEKTHFLNVLVCPGRKWAKQERVVKGNFLRIKGHLENNAYQDKEGNWKGGVEINADSIIELKRRDDGKIENAETGEVVTIEENVEIAES